MKNKLLLLFIMLLPALLFAQTYTWSTATDNGATITETTTFNGSPVIVTLSTSGNNALLLNGGGFAGSSGNVVLADVVVESFTFSFNSPVSILSIVAFSSTGTGTDTWIFTPSGGTNSAVSANVDGTVSTVNLNWTNVNSFTVTRQSGGNGNFAFDDIALGALVTNTAPTASNFIAPNGPYEDLAYIFNTSSFGYNDGDGDPLNNILIEAIPDQGTLYIDANNNDTLDSGEALVNGATVSLANLNAGNFQYIQNGALNNNFRFRVNDGTENSAASYQVFLNLIAKPTVTLSVSPSSRSEDDNANNVLTATLSNAYGTAVTVNLAFSGSASRNVDYSLSNNRLVIPAGSTTASLNIINVDDSFVEQDETVIVDIASTNGIEDGVQRATYTIENDDTATLSIAATTQAAEDATDGLFTISTSNQFRFPVTVSFTVSGTATSGTDYASVGTSFIFPANQSTATIVVDVIADAVFEGDETVIVNLASTNNTDVTIGSSSSATITITENDAANNAPTAASFTAANGPFEDTSYIFGTSDFSYSDAESDPLNNLLIEAIPAAGSLYLDGNDNDIFDIGEALGNGSTVSLGDLNAGNLQYVQGGSSTNTSFQFEVNDGTEDSTGDYIATLNVIGRPVITNLTPADDATGVARNSNLVIQFDKNIAFGTGSISIVDLDDNSGSITIDVSSPGTQASISGRNLTINPDSDLDNFTNFAVQISANAIEGTDNSTFAGISDNTTYNFQTTDDSPAITSTTPADDATAVGAGSNLEIIFDKNFILNTGNITLVDLDDNSNTIVIDVENNNNQLGIFFTQLRINPTLPLGNFTNYAVQIDDTAIIGRNGVLFDGISDNTTFNFKTSDTAPVLLSSTPADDATGVNRNANISLTFDQNVVLGTSGTIQLIDVTDNSNTVSIDISSPNGQLSRSNQNIVINPNVQLDGASNYAVQISNGAIVNNLAAVYAGISDNTTLNFTTLDERPVVTSVAVPANGNYSAGQALNFTVNFDKNVVVNLVGGTPSIALTIGSTVVQASYVSGSSTNALLFTYNVQANLADPDGIEVGTLRLNGGNIADTFGNNANLTLNNVASTTGVLVVVPTSGLQVAAADTEYVIDFDNTVAGINNGSFAGTGLTSFPAAGRLNSNGIVLRGLSDGNTSLGGTFTTGDYARGAASGDVTTGGVYSFDVSNGGTVDRALGIQPGGSDFRPGSISIRFENQTGATITSLSVLYEVLTNETTPRNNSFNFGHGSDFTTPIPVADLNFNAPTTATPFAATKWRRNQFQTNLTGLNITAGSAYYLVWSGNDVTGSGNRPQFALDDIKVVANPSTVVNNISGEFETITIDGSATATAGTTVVGSVNVPGGNLTSSGNITFKSSASRSAILKEITAGGSITGNVTVEQFYPATRAFRFVSSPVNMTGSLRDNWQEGGSTVPGFGTHITGGTVADGFDQNGSGDPSLFGYNTLILFAPVGWLPISSDNGVDLTAASSALPAGIPLRMFIRGDRTISLTINDVPNSTTLRSRGTLATGDITLPGSFVTNFDTDVDQTFAFVGNPYQAQVDLSQTLSVANSEDINPNFYYAWQPNTNNYVTYDFTTGGVQNGVSSLIQPGQSFFVITDAASGSTGGYDPEITFRENQKSNNTFTTATYSSPSSDVTSVRVALNQASNTSQFDTDYIIARYSPTGDDLITSLDARKIYGISEQLYIKSGADYLSIENRSSVVNGTVLNLGLAYLETGAYKFDVNIDNLLGFEAVLVDEFLQTSQVITLDTQNTFNFTVDENDAASIAETRFRIEFTTGTLSSGEVAFAKAVQLYPNPISTDILNVSGLQAGKVQVVVTNLLGQQVNSTTIDVSGNSAQINGFDNLNSGVYLVTLSQEGQSVTKRVVVE